MQAGHNFTMLKFLKLHHLPISSNSPVLSDLGNPDIAKLHFPPAHRTGRGSSPIWRNISPTQLRGRLQFLGALSLRTGRRLERLIKGRKVSEAFKFVSISFPMCWLFATIGETKRGLVLFNKLHFLELKIKYVGGLPYW